VLARRQVAPMGEATGAKMSATDAKLNYRIDAGKSRFTVRVFASGMLSALGHSPTLEIGEYTGEASFAPENPEQASLHIVVKSSSLEVTDDISRKDRTEIKNTMDREVLESSPYPDITFRSSQVSLNILSENRYAVSVTGDLTLHGVTRSETISAQVTASGNQLRANGEFSLRQSDYTIKLVSVAGGTLKVKDEVKITFDLTARKQEG
jgi:polyisoprenoid-binding protein YceI